ncbi:unnamed protein product (macronuclear) [Paramecium tetraurelia]|uniref:Uncharacterized protein n=1 Tax=Paramecium tetraurelia TaxID=5888 RepID=A0D5N5_PARTE|nr:uncharacterized protein GSPATT00013782001 [Paramecium tetraurelia]CAK78352.1 unnamed protein product [Paramecium tetraurelia]|eukprot:XP_001445749.1 hypothetical protein (macronuclear) [Paramecium tetraurelia strain d4-2]
MDQEMIRKWLNYQRMQRVISAQQNLMRNTMIPDIDNKYQINIAKLSNEKSKTVYNYAVHRNTKIGETIKNYIIQAQNRVSQRRRQIKPIRFKTQQSTRTETSAERSYNICPQHSIYLNNRKSVRTIEFTIEFLQEKLSAQTDHQTKHFIFLNKTFSIN